MSASRTRKERQAELALGLTPKQKKELEDEKKRRRNFKIYTAIGIVAVIAVAFLLIWDSGVVQKNTTAITIGDKSYGVVDLDYYYYSAYSNYYSYASYLGLDTDEDLDKQEYYEGYTWHDLLCDTAVSSLTSVSMLVAEAEAEGYTLSEDGQATVDSYMSYASLYAALYSVTVDYYLQSSYGQYMTSSDYERILTDYMLATEYSEYKLASFEVTDDEIEDYYSENAATLDTLDYTCYYLTFSRTGTDDDGESYDLSDEEIEENRATTEAEMQEIVDALAAGDTDTAAELATTYGASDYSNFSSISYYGFYDWLCDADSQAGSYALIENTNSSDVVNGYFAIYINERYLDEYYPVNARVITISAEEDDDGELDMDTCLAYAEEALAAFEISDMTGDDFGSIYDLYDDDLSYDGGLIEEINKSAYSNEEVIAWLFADARVEGDYVMITDEDNGCCYLLYFESLCDTLYWKSVAISSLQSTKYSDWSTEVSENYEAKTGFAYRFVG